MDIKRKTDSYVLITGASRGIGRASARCFAQNGYNLILTCRKNIEILDELCRELAKEFDVDCRGYLCDGSSSGDVQNMFSDLGRQADNLEILVNNAGISVVGLFQDMSDDTWHDVINSNLSSVFYMCRAAVPFFLRKKRGRIINVSSVWGEYGASCEAAYSASKGGINSFTRALGKELAPSNISANAVAFGAVDTDMNSFMDSSERLMLTDEIPAGRMATPDEAGRFIYQVSQMEPYLTGQVITFNGGWF